MPRNGSGVYTPPSGTYATTNTTISSSAYDGFLSDISTEMTNSVNVNGTAPMQRDLNMGLNSITNMANGSAPTDAASMAQLAQVIPSGSVFWFAASTPPTGFLECNGASISTVTYATLFGVTAYTFGGSGANFNLPDLRGNFIRGWDDGRGVDTGQTFGSGQVPTGPASGAANTTPNVALLPCIKY